MNSDSTNSKYHQHHCIIDYLITIIIIGTYQNTDENVSKIICRPWLRHPVVCVQKFVHGGHSIEDACGRRWFAKVGND